MADEGIPLREIASVIGRRLKLPVLSQTFEEAQDHFGWFTQFVAGGVPASSQWTREQLGWQPKQPGLLADIEQPYYFAADVTPVVQALGVRIIAGGIIIYEILMESLYKNHFV